MTAEDSAIYKMKLAREHLELARLLLSHRQWGGVGLNAQLSTENSAKAVLFHHGRPNKTHEPWKQLAHLVTLVDDEVKAKKTARLTELARLMGMVEHVLATYGDEVAQRTPKDIYDERKAKNAVAIAEEAERLATELTCLSQEQNKKPSNVDGSSPT